MLADGRAERLVTAGNLRRGILHQSLSGFQPASPVAVAVALAGLRTVLVVIPPNRVAGFTLKRFFHDQPRCQLDRLTSSSLAELVDSRKRRFSLTFLDAA